MAIKINVKESYLDFDILEKEYRVSTDDEARRSWVEAYENYEAKKEKVSSLTDEEIEEMSLEKYDELSADVKTALKESYDLMFSDKGVFEEIYSKTKDSTSMVEIFNVVDNEVGKYLSESSVSPVQKYQEKLAKKRNRRKS